MSLIWHKIRPKDLRLLTLSYVGRIFPEVRDEVGVVFPLEFPECKGMLLCASNPGLFLPNENR